MSDIKECPSFFSILPATVRYDKRLIPSAKILYSEISALCNKQGYCWASNEYFANLYEVSKQTISTWLTSLESCGHISRKIIYKQNTKQVLSRAIYLTLDPTKHSLDTPIQENLNTPIQENLMDNNTLNTINNKGIINNINTLKDEELKERKKSTKKKKENVVDENKVYFEEDKALDEMLKLFIVDRHERKKPMTSNAINLLIKKLNECIPECRIKLLEDAISKGWSGIYPKDSDKLTSTNASTTSLTTHEVNDEETSNAYSAASGGYAKYE